MTKTLTALLLSATLIACGGVAAPTDGATDAEIPDVVVVDHDADAMPIDAIVPDTTVPDAELDASTDADTAVEEDSSVPNDGSMMDAGTEPDAEVPPDAMVPVGYKLEVWGFTLPTMRRRYQAAAPGYTNWQTHDPAEALLANRAIDTEIRMGLLSSPVFTDTSEAHGTTTPLLVSAVDDYSDTVSRTVGFVDYDGPGIYEAIGGCAAGWMTSEAIVDSLATGNIQTTTCAAPTHSPSGVAMFNADIVVEWRVVAVY